MALRTERWSDPGPWVMHGGGAGEEVAIARPAMPVAEKVAAHIAHHDPVAVLRRCAADRELIERFQYHEQRYRNRVEASHTNRACRIDVYFAVRVMIQRLAAGYGISTEEETG